MTAEMVDLNTGEILPPTKTLATIEPSDIDKAADPGAFVVMCLERSKTWLTEALEQGDIGSIVEMKSQAEAIRVYTMQKQLGKDVELSAAEIVRRAERGLGLAIRRGQELGEIRTVADGGPRGPYMRGDQLVHATPVLPDERKRSPADFFSGGQEQYDTYRLADGVTDDQFDDAVEEAKAEGNLSRANVVRKVKGERPKLARPEVLRNMRHIDPNRVVEQTVLHSGMSESVAELLDYSALDRDRLEGWVSSLTEVIRSLTTLKRNLMKELTRDEG